MTESATRRGPSVPSETFRRVLSTFPTGVVIIAAVGSDGRPVGMTVGSFTSVSLDPPLVGFLPAKASTSFQAIRESGKFCVNVLAADQVEACRRFATRGAEKFKDVATPRPSGAPLLDGAIAYIDCAFESVIEAGDHYIVVARVSESKSRETTLLRWCSTAVATGSSRAVTLRSGRTGHPGAPACRRRLSPIHGGPGPGARDRGA